MNTDAEHTSRMIGQAELTDSLPVNDISDQIREAVIHLQRDLDGVTARVRSLEVSALSASLHNSVVSDYKLINCTYSPGEKHQVLKCVLTTEEWFVQGPEGIRPDQKVFGQMLWNQLYQIYLDDGCIPFSVCPFWLDTFFPKAVLLLETPLIHCSGNLSKFLHHLKFGSSHISKLFTSHGVLILGEGLQFYKEVFICFCTLSKSEAADSWCSVCCAVSSCGMIFATCLMLRSFIKIPLHKSKEIPWLSSTSHLVSLWSVVTKACSFAHTSSFLLSEDHPDLSSHSATNVKMCFHLQRQ